MTYKAQDVAERLIYEARQRDIEMTPMKLQKLLYYAQGYSLGMNGDPLFSEEIQAWQHGSVVPVVYKIYSKYGSNVITELVENKMPKGIAGLIGIIFMYTSRWGYILKQIMIKYQKYFF